MAHDRFEAFRLLVLRSLALQEQLRAVGDTRDFVRLVVRLGGEHGYAFSEDDVRPALAESRRAWAERWVV